MLGTVALGRPVVTSGIKKPALGGLLVKAAQAYGTYPAPIIAIFRDTQVTFALTTKLLAPDTPPSKFAPHPVFRVAFGVDPVFAVCCAAAYG